MARHLYSSTAVTGNDISARRFFVEEGQPSESFGISRVYAPVNKVPVNLKEPVENLSIATFAGTIIHIGKLHYRLYATIFPSIFDSMHIAVWESGDGLTWEPVKLKAEDRAMSNVIHLTGIPGRQDFIGQPQVIRLPDGRWYMYCWKHKDGHCRYVRAESGNGLEWNVPDFDSPALYHPNEGKLNAWASGVPLRKITGLNISKKEAEKHLGLISNDATYVYYNEISGRFECYSIWHHPGVPGRLRHKGTPGEQTGIIRLVQRRVSKNGINWSCPELILMPDDNDPWDLQFYYLSVQWHEDWMVGGLGYYRVEEGQDTMDMELCFSRDGQRWHRPVRGGFIPRSPENSGIPDTMGIYAPNAWIDKNDKWLCLYTGTPDRHDGEKHRAFIMGATFGKNRFVGLRAGKVTGGFISDTFILQKNRIELDGCINGWLRAEICDAFGNKLTDFHLMDSCPVTGDSEKHILRWRKGKVSDLMCRCLRLRVEFREGTVYSFAF